MFFEISENFSTFYYHMATPAVVCTCQVYSLYDYVGTITQMHSYNVQAFLQSAIQVVSCTT